MKRALNEMELIKRNCVTDCDSNYSSTRTTSRPSCLVSPPPAFRWKTVKLRVSKKNPLRFLIEAHIFISKDSFDISDRIYFLNGVNKAEGIPFVCVFS